MFGEIICEFERALRAPGQSPLPRAVLGLKPTEVDKTDFKRALGSVIYQTTALKAVHKRSEFDFKDVDSLYVESLRSACPTYLVEALNYLRLYQALAECMRLLNLGKGERWFSTDLHKDSARLIAAVEGVHAFEPDLVSSRLVLAKLWALQDRGAARRLFAEAITDLDSDLGIFHHDCGATTFFDDAQLGRATDVIAKRQKFLPQRHEFNPIATGGTRFLIVMSCEQNYLRMYLPYWFSVAEYLGSRGFAYHFVLTDATAEASDIVEDAEALLQAMARFRNHDPATYCRNVSFSSVSIPPWCSDAPTFSACARLLYARDIAECTEMRVICQDIDLCVTEDPFPWFEALPADKIALTSERVALTIDPWRKFPGGTYVLPHKDSAFALSRRVEDYLLNGLAERHPWYLDQNALAYLYDTAGGATNDLLYSLADMSMVRPSHAHKVHYLLKALYLESLTT